MLFCVACGTIFYVPSKQFLATPKNVRLQEHRWRYLVITYRSCIVHLNSCRWQYGQNIHYPATYTDLPELRTCNSSSLRRDVTLLLADSNQPNFRGGYVAIILVSTILKFHRHSLSPSLSLSGSGVRKYPVESTKKYCCKFSFKLSCRKSYKGLQACLQNSSIIKYTGNDTETLQVKSIPKEWDFHDQINSKLSLLKIHYK